MKKKTDKINTEKGRRKKERELTTGELADNNLAFVHEKFSRAKSSYETEAKHKTREKNIAKKKRLFN